MAFGVSLKNVELRPTDVRTVARESQRLFERAAEYLSYALE